MYTFKKLLTLFIVGTFSFFAHSQLILFDANDSLNFEFRLPKNTDKETIQIEKSANNNCVSAVPLTPGAACVSGNTLSDNTQAGEIAPPCAAFGGGGITDRTSWYRFTASSTQMVLDYMRIVQTNCITSLAVYGPFSTGGGCLPTAAQSVYCESGIAAGDPGDHNLISGLIVGQDYLIQILNKDCGGSNSGEAFYCIGVSDVASNNTATTAATINACGTAFNGSNAQGYYPSGTGTALANLDNNGATTCGGCAAGNDVPYVINNDSWFNFCSANAGQWQVNFNVGTCFQSAPNNGLQMSILTGSPTNLTNFQNAPSPTAPGGSFTSSVINLTAGQCVYLIVDGFAGDQCSYSYTLTNLSGGCVILPVELKEFSVQRLGRSAHLKWNVESEINNSYFIVERSLNGVEWEFIRKEPSIGEHNYPYEYSFIDNLEFTQIIYYRLSQTDTDGKNEVLAVAALNGFETQHGIQMKVVPNPVIADEGINISIESSFSTDAQFSLIDPLGKVIATRQSSIVNGGNVIQINDIEIQNGIYYIEINTPQERKRVKFYKL